MKQIQKSCKNEAEQNVEETRVWVTEQAPFCSLLLTWRRQPYATPGLCAAYAAFQCHRTVGQVPLHPVVKAECGKLQWKVGVQEDSVSVAFAGDIMRLCSSRQHVNEQSDPCGEASCFSKYWCWDLFARCIIAADATSIIADGLLRRIQFFPIGIFGL